MILVLIYIWEDARTWRHWNSSLDTHFNCLGAHTSKTWNASSCFFFFFPFLNPFQDELNVSDTVANELIPVELGGGYTLCSITFRLTPLPLSLLLWRWAPSDSQCNLGLPGNLGIFDFPDNDSLIKLEPLQTERAGSHSSGSRKGRTTIH